MESTLETTEEFRIASELFENERYEEAFEKYRVLAEKGLVAAQLLLGWMYHAGKGVHQNLEEAENGTRGRRLPILPKDNSISRHYTGQNDSISKQLNGLKSRHRKGTRRGYTY